MATYAYPAVILRDIGKTREVVRQPSGLPEVFVVVDHRYDMWGQREQLAPIHEVSEVDTPMGLERPYSGPGVFAYGYLDNSGAKKWTRNPNHNGSGRHEAASTEGIPGVRRACTHSRYVESGFGSAYCSDCPAVLIRAPDLTWQVRHSESICVEREDTPATGQPIPDFASLKRELLLRLPLTTSDLARILYLPKK